MADTFKENANCLTCGYQLRGLPNPICPECGRAFDFGDPSTYSSESSQSRWRRWAKPPSSIECSIICTLSLLAVVSSSGAGCWDELHACRWVFLGAPLWVGLLVFSVMRFVACRRDRIRAQYDRQERHRSNLRWLCMPLCVILVISCIVSPWPLYLRFRLSQDAFNAAIQDYKAGKFVANKWVGLYYVEGVGIVNYFNGRSTIWFITGTSIGDPVGFEYDPLPNKPKYSGSINVGPSWYTYED